MEVNSELGGLSTAHTTKTDRVQKKLLDLCDAMSQRIFYVHVQNQRKIREIDAFRVETVLFNVDMKPG